MERRHELRMRTSKAGRISAPGLEPVACRVLDLSLTGARLEVASEFAPVDLLKLVFEGDDATHHCRIVWRRGSQVGVSFV